MAIGRTTLPQYTGRPTRVSADGYPIYKTVGVTVAWELVTAAVSQTELADGTPVYVGEKAIPLGTVMVPVTTAETQTIAITGSPDGGVFGITVSHNAFSQTFSFAYNIAAADMQTAFRSMAVQGASNITVTLSSTTYTVIFPALWGDVTAMVADSTGLTGGTDPAATVATTVAGLAGGGKYAPLDTTKSDGRQTATRDSIGILDYSIKQTDIMAMGVYNDTETIGLIIGGLCWRERVLFGGSGQVTLSNLQTAMPLLRLTPAE